MDLERCIREDEIQLSPKEAHSLREWQRSNLPALAPDLQAKLFELYLRGYDTDAIRRDHRTLTLGQIVHARIAGRRRTATTRSCWRRSPAPSRKKWLHI